MQERLELMRAMKESEFALKPGECDYTPPLELIGIYIAHSTVSRMVAQGDLDVAAGTYLNAALGCHTFSILHHCTHESISQHNPEHEAFENTVFRLACMLIKFDDGYKEAHRAHHARTNQIDDPDRVLSHSPLPHLGNLLNILGGGGEGHPVYVHLGAPITETKLAFLHYCGLVPLLSKLWFQKRVPVVNWDNVLLKMALFKGQQVLQAHEEYADLHRALRATWHSSNVLTLMLLTLFFARYPHRNGTECVNEIDSFYDQNFRGQGQVDLWMMGEGPHHMHHAKSDVSYALLPKICADVEERKPHLKLAARGNADVQSLEYTHNMPPKLLESSEQSMQFPWDRTLAIRESKDRLLRGESESAIAQIAETVLSSALHCCGNADRKLLCQIHKDMKLPSLTQAKDHPVPIAMWPETVLSDSTAELLAASSVRIKAEVRRVAQQAGAKFPRVSSEEDIKDKYVDFFGVLADTVVSSEHQRLFLQRCAKSFPTAPQNIDRTSTLARLREFLASPVPANFERMTGRQYIAKNAKTDYGRTRQKMSDVLFGQRSKL